MCTTLEFQTTSNDPGQQENRPAENEIKQNNADKPLFIIGIKTAYNMKTV